MANLVSDFFLVPRCCLAVLAVGREREEVESPPDDEGGVCLAVLAERKKRWREGCVNVH